MPVGLYAGANVSNGNGVTVAFPYNFKILDQTHVEVKVDGVLAVLGADYTVSGVGNSNGGNVTFGVAPANGAVVQRARKVPYKRDQDYQYNGDLREEVVDPDLDTIEMQVQQVAADIARCFKAPLSVTTDQVSSDADWAAAAGKFLRRKNDGSGIEFVAASPSDDTFTATGVGAVPRSWSAKVGETALSVKDFGAVGNGIANDTAYIQAAFTALPIGGRAFMPRGTYKTNATLTLNDGTTVQGEGRDVTIISSTVASDILKLSGTNISQASKKCVFDLSLVGNGAGTTSGIAASYLSYAEIARVSIRNCQVGTLTDHANEIEYNQVYADSNTQDGHWVGPVTNNVVYRLCQGTGNVRAGFYQFGGGGVLWSGGVLEANGYGALITSSGGSRPSGTTIQGAYFEGNTTREVQCQDDGGGAPRGVTLIGNTYTFIAGKAAQAIRLESVDGFQEIGGTFRDDGGQYTNSLFVNNAGTITGDVSFNPAKDTSTGGATAAGNQYFRDETRLRAHAAGQFTVAGAAITGSRTFGVQSIVYIAAGVYEITLKKAPNGGTNFTIVCSAENGAVFNALLASPGIPSSATVFRIMTARSDTIALNDARTVNFTVWP